MLVPGDLPVALAELMDTISARVGIASKINDLQQRVNNFRPQMIAVGPPKFSVGCLRLSVP